MNNIENVTIKPLDEHRFINPVEINYTQDGTKKRWEAVESHDSVATLLYHREKHSFLLVKQFRPAVYIHNSDDSFPYELCAGILDKEVSAKQTAQEEIDEECGYRVAIDAIEKITSFYTSVGFAGAKQTLYYAQIDNSMKIHDGGGIHDEEIELYFLPVERARAFVFDESKPKTPGLMFAFYWFFENKMPIQTL